MKTKVILFLMSTALFMCSCKNKEEYIDLNFSGTINGHIEHVFAEFGGELLKTRIKVEIIRESISTTTDEEGKFSLTNVPTGTYDLKFSRSDIADFEYHDVEIIGGDVPVVIKEEINLIQKSTSSISSISIWKDGNRLYFDADAEQNDGLHRLIIFFTSKTKPPDNPQISDFKGWYIKTYSDYAYSSYEINTYWYSDTLYVKAYGASYY